MSRHKDSHIKLAALCRSFGNPTRVAIMEKLAEKENCIEDEIINVGDIAEPTVVEHLRSMKHEGIIKGRLTKSKMSYCINWDKLDEFKVLFDQMYEQVKQHQNNVLCNKGNCG